MADIPPPLSLLQALAAADPRAGAVPMTSFVERGTAVPGGGAWGEVESARAEAVAAKSTCASPAVSPLELEGAGRSVYAVGSLSMLAR